jgi:hypothetical protein
MSVATRLRTAVPAAVIASCLVGAMASTVAASSDASGCSTFDTITMAIPLPAGYWSTGTHAFEFRASFDSGSTFDVPIDNSITVTPGTPLYKGHVLLKLFYNLGQSFDRSVSDVTTIDPSQRSEFNVQVYFDRGDTAWLSSFVQTVRWQTGNGTGWTTPVAMPRTPVTVACAPGGSNHWGGFFVRTLGSVRFR